jgi:hypothetical protein
MDKISKNNGNSREWLKFLKIMGVPRNYKNFKTNGNPREWIRF